MILNDCKFNITMPQLANEGLETLVNAHVLFLSQRDLGENTLSCAKKVQIARVDNLNFYFVGPAEDNVFLGVSIGTGYETSKVLQVWANVDGIITVILKEGTTYEIHQRKDTIPADRNYEVFDVDKYHQRYRELR